MNVVQATVVVIKGSKPTVADLVTIYMVQHDLVEQVPVVLEHFIPHFPVVSILYTIMVAVDSVVRYEILVLLIVISVLFEDVVL